MNQAASFNPFTHAVEWIRYATDDKDPCMMPRIVLGTLVLGFGLACWGYDPQRVFGSLSKRDGGASPTLRSTHDTVGPNL